MVRVAVIDVGTVTARLAIADVDGDRVRHIHRESEIVNLGQGVDKTGMLAPEACSRLLECVDAYLSRIEEADVAATCCTMTSAARDASNAQDLVDAFSARGLAAQVIPGEVEGSLTFLGVAQDFPDTALLVADSGGGSTEFVLGVLSAEEGLEIARVQSFDVGCRRITERFLPGTGPAAATGVKAAHAFAARAFVPVGAWGRETLCVPERLCVTGGTATTLVALERELVPYDSAQVHLATLTRAQVARQEERLASLSVKGRAELPGIQAKRAPVMLGGTIVVAEAMEAAGFSELTVSESDLLVGLTLTVAACAQGRKPALSWEPKLS